MKTHAALFALAFALPMFAASEYPPSYRWQTITTEHFYVHFHQGEEELAARASVMAERIHARIAPLIDYAPAERTHIILSDHVDVSNGSATPFPNNRVEIYVSAPGSDPSSSIEYYDNWLNLVLTHEYTHILHMDQARAFPGFMRRAFGRTPLFGFPNALSPLWMLEGIATLIESEATDAGRLKGTFVDMVLRTAAVENNWASEAQAGGLSPAWPGGSARYFYGSKFLGWLARTRGLDKLAAYFHDYSGNFVPYRVNASAEDIYKTSMTALWNEWSATQQREYRDEAEAIARDGSTRRERLTALGFETKYPIVSPDGTRVAYVHQGPYGWPTLRVYDLAAKRDVATREVNSTSPLSWSADGRTIAFAQLDYRGSFALVSDVYLWNLDRGVRRLTYGARAKDPALLPDGRTVIAVENRAGRNRLVEIDAQSGAVRPLVAPTDFTQFSEPNVSHDGTRIAVAEWRNGRVDVVVYDRSGKRLANLTDALPRSTNASPRWSRDDATIWFSSDVTGIPNIFSVGSTGGAPRRLTNVYGGAFFPSSTDGRTIYVSDYSSRGWDLAALDAGEFPVHPRTIPKTIVGRNAEVADITADAPAPPMPPTTPYSPLTSGRPRWWYPVLSAGSSNADQVDFSVGAGTSGGDVLGFHTYDATIAAHRSAGRTRPEYTLLYAYDRFYPTFTIEASGLSDAVSGISIADTATGHVSPYRERSDRLVAEMMLPLRHIRWQLSGSTGLVREHVSSDVEVSRTTLARAGIFTGTLQGTRFAASFNNAHEFGYSVSPENGIRALATFENMTRRLGSDASLRQATGDVRGFLAIPFARSPVGRHALAVRAAAGTTSGDFVLQREFRVGGTGLGELAQVGITEFPVRGYATGTLRGRNAAIASLEYRFPLWQVDRGPSSYPLFFQRLVGDVFYDRGTAWNRTPVTLPTITRPRGSAFGSENTILSAGAEAGLDFVLGVAVPLRYRLGAAYLFDGFDRGKVRGYLTLGSSF